jgi:putative YphP/YqiW family bacilliredoxin
MEYPEEIVAPMRKEITDLGAIELKTPDQVDKALKNNKETTLVMINSICGCAGKSARPALKQALKTPSKKPEKFFTLFAGQDREATQHLREIYLKDFQPSSPSIAIFSKGNPVAMIGRNDIIGREVEEVAEKIKDSFNEYF